MALQAPQYNGPRMGQMPFVQADGDAFGAAEYRQAGQLAKQGLNAGLDVLAAAQEQQKKCDTAIVKNATNQMRIEMLGEEERILAATGMNEMDAPAAISAAYDKLYRKYSSTISGGNIERQEMFNTFANGMRADYDLRARRKQVKAEIQAEKDAVNFEIDANFREIESLGSNIAEYYDQDELVGKDGTVNPPINPGYDFSARLLKIHSDIDAANANAPEIYRQSLKDEATARAHIVMTDSMARNDPGAALEWFDRDEVREAMPYKAWNAQMKKLTDAAIEFDENAELSRYTSKAITLAQSGGDVANLYAELVGTVGVEMAKNVMTAYDVWDEMTDEARAEAETAADKARAEREDREGEEAARTGRTLAESPEMTNEDLRKQAHELFPEKAAKVLIESFEAERKAVAADEVVRSTERKKALELEFEAAGGNAARMASNGKALSEGGMTSEEKIAFSERSGKLNKPTLNERVYNDALFNMEPNDIVDILRNPNLSQKFVDNLGGYDSESFNKVYARVNKLIGGGGTGSGNGTAITTLDSDLNNVKRQVEISLHRTGLYANDNGKRDYAVNSAIAYARNRYEEEMAAAGVDDIKKLPPTLRNAIQAEAALVVALEDGSKVTASEAWADGKDLYIETYDPKSLAPNFQQNYTGGNVILEGGEYKAVGVPMNVLPEQARGIIKGMPASRIAQYLEDGTIEIVPYDQKLPAYRLDRDGGNPRRQKRSSMSKNVSVNNEFYPLPIITH